MKKRGIRAQSGVISLILIILIILVAIVILWNVVIFTLKNSSDEVSINQFAFKGDLVYALGSSNTTMNVSVHRGSGEGNITGFKLIFDFSDGTSKVYENKTVYPNELETRVYLISNNTLNVVNFSKLTKISLYYTFNENNKEKISIELDNAKMPSSEISGSGSTACTDTCSSLSYQCGTQTICGVSQNCGTCNGLINVQSSSCSNFLCKITCNSNYGNCDDNNMTGCESNLQTDNNNCGSCGNNCTAQGKTCSSGSCVGLISSVIYDMSGVTAPAGATSNKAWASFSLALPTSLSNPGLEATNTNYTRVSTINGVAWLNSAPIIANRRPYKIFRFYVPLTGITKLNGTVRGYATSENGGNYTLFIFNNNTAGWEYLANNSAEAYRNISGVKTTNLANYLDENNYIYLATLGHPQGGGVTSDLYDDYVSLNVSFSS